MAIEEKKTNSNLESVENVDLTGGSKFSSFEKEAGENEKNILKKEKETAREVVGAEKESIYSQTLSRIKASVSVSDEIKEDAQKISQEKDVQSLINNLVDLALNKGVKHAVKVARYTQDNYVLDQFHDKLLTEELHRALINKGLLEDI